jgi:S1-C subfamily serine protease
MKAGQRRTLIIIAFMALLVSLACALPFIGTGGPLNSSTGNMISTLTDAKEAVIQIESQGTFLDPTIGVEENVAGRGSGFIIDPSGIAVTNNHVVTGAALVKVWVNGEAEPRNAEVLGYSECNDLAVIKIEGADFNYMDWYDGPITTGLEVYLAGFPLGEPEYSLTKGIVSKEHTLGDTSWSAITGGVLVHDATSNPGNSGGPLLDKDGKVVAVNFAGRQSAGQYFAIPADTAIPIVADLEKGVNFESIGINGTIVANEDGSITGIWVSSVASGSPADKTRLKPGDIITHMEGLALGTDGTMKDYCSILRTHKDTSSLTVKVLRLETGEILEGQINGRELEVIATLDGKSSNSSNSNSSSGSSSGAASDADTYTDEFDGNLNNYDYFVFGSKPSASELSIYTSNDKLYFDIDGDYWPYLFYKKQSFSDVMIGAVVNNQHNTRQKIKLICRYDPDLGWYEFWIDSAGYYQIEYNDRASYDIKYLTKFSTSNLINTGDTDTYIAACTGNELSLYIDDHLIATTTDSHFKSGYVGLGVSPDSSYGYSVVASFEKFLIKALK